MAAIDAAAWYRPDVMVLDYWMVGAPGGPEAASAIMELVDGCRVLLTSGIHGAAHVERALGAGAAGYLPKTMPVDHLAEAVCRSSAGESPLFAEQLSALVTEIETVADQVDERSARLAALTAREQSILRGVAMGQSVHQAAREHFLSVGTVRNHIHDILRKTGARSQLEAVQIFKGAAPHAFRSAPPGRKRQTADAGPGAVSVIVADEQDLMAEGLAEALDGMPGVNVVSVHSGNGTEALQAAVKLATDVVVYDYWMPATSGPGLARYLEIWSPRTKVILTSWLHGPNQVARAYASGAVGLVAKSVSVSQLLESVEAAHAGEPLLHAEPSPHSVGRPSDSHEPEQCWRRLGVLTPREVAVLHLLCTGRSREEVADDLGITAGTARNHLSNILKKTGCETKQEAVELARHEGLVREAGAPTF